MEQAGSGGELSKEAVQAIFDILCDIYYRTRPGKQRIIVLDRKTPEQLEAEAAQKMQNSQNVSL